jgi:hypothetical protein
MLLNSIKFVPFDISRATSAVRHQPFDISRATSAVRHRPCDIGRESLIVRQKAVSVQQQSKGKSRLLIPVHNRQQTAPPQAIALSNQGKHVTPSGKS